jgi:hypothetical protein
MNLKTALDLVITDTREQNGDDLPDTTAVELARTCDHEDVNATVEQPTLRAAYHLVLDASAAAITEALA